MAVAGQSQKKLSDGSCYPLGASLAEDGVNFALYTRNAGEVYLLLFDRPDGEPTDVIKLATRTKFIWHTFVHGIKAG
ncbi:MAG: glycogen debranching enzyme GlgX, partial [Chloroflexota bacterium]